MATMPTAECLVTVGVDSHKELHVAVALDQLGRRLGVCTVATTPRGFGQLERWAQRWGVIQRFGIEGTGSYAAGLARWLAARGHQVVEVNRPNRQTRRRHGKSDPIDAEAAARAALGGQGLVRPKAADGTVEMLRVLRMARRSAIKSRTQTIQQLDSLVVTAPDRLRAKLRRLSLEQLVPVAARLRPGELAGPLAATKLALRTLARRHQPLSAEVAHLDQQMAKLTATTAPRLLARGGSAPRPRPPY
jgi:transposase